MNLMLMLAAAALALGGLLCTLHGLVQRVRRPVRRYCPGPARGFRRMLGLVLPWRTLCGYDLSGRPDARTPCPECGVMAARRDHGLPGQILIAGPLARGGIGELIGAPEIAAHAREIAAHILTLVADGDRPSPAAKRPAVRSQTGRALN